MSSFNWRYYWIGGFLLGLLRGLMEVIRLNADYRLNTSIAFFTVQTCLLYGFVIASAGIIPAFFLYKIFAGKMFAQMLVPLGFLLVITAVDFVAVKTSVPVTCRYTQGMPPRYTTQVDPADILIITLDTFRADYAGVYGNNYVRTPTLDRLARNGISVIDAIAPIPITTSSHATIFTGLDPPEHGSRFNAVPIHPETQTMAEVFRDHGYKTGAFVSAFPVTHEVSGLARGFDVYDQLLTPSRLHPLIYRTTMIRGLTGYGPFRPAARKWFRVLPPVKRWWSMTGDNPRFSWIHMFDPHFPYEPGFPFDQMYLYNAPQYEQCVFDIANINRSDARPSQSKIDEYKNLYAGEVTAVDHAIETLIRFLQNENRFDKTLVVVTADHGESLDEHEYFFSHGDNVMDPSLRVPMIAAYPDTIQANRIIPGQMRLASLAGVVYKLAGVSKEALPNPNVNDVYKSWTGEHERVEDEYAFSETGSGVYTRTHVPSKDRILGKQRSVRSVEFKVVFHDEAVRSGYNLVDDPAETESLQVHSNDRLLYMEQTLTDYIHTFDAIGTAPAEIPDENVLKQLQLLGYID
jgi:arylsulfatase A-like enzyme